MKIKTIDINAKEWFDKVNGNSYFSAEITTDSGTPEAQSYTIPFQNGYGHQYIHEAEQLLKKEGVVSLAERERLWSYCHENNIVLKKNIQKNCLKRDLIDHSGGKWNIDRQRCDHPGDGKQG